MLRRDFISQATAFAAPVHSPPARLIAVLISAHAEWLPVRHFFTPAGAAMPAGLQRSPYGEFFFTAVDGAPMLVFEGGWGKMAAAGSAQYVIDRFKPEALLNLGTCGGMQGAIERGQTVLAERTIVYDIVERMGDADQAIAERSALTPPPLFAAPLPTRVVRATLVSADGDLAPGDIARLRTKYGAVAADWESGSVAWVAQQNRVPALILRTVSDLVSEQGGEAYGNEELFRKRTETIMRDLLQRLPEWRRFLLQRISRTPGPK